MNDFRHPSDRDDEDLRRLLEDAVSDVEPRRGIDSIHARTKVVPMQSKRAWLIGAGAAAVATAATVAGVVALTDGGTTDEVDVAGPTASASPSPGPTTAPSSPSPSASPSPTPSETAGPSSPAPQPAVEAVPVYYVGETSRGPRLFREFHRVEVAGGRTVSAAVNEAVSLDPDDPDYRTLWPLGVTAAQVDAPPADVITVDVRSQKALRGRPDGMSSEQAEVSVQQLVYTAQAADQSRRPVQLLLNGGRTDTLLGVPVSEPLAQADASAVLAQVWVIDPGEGAEVSSPFEVSGLAAAFEANVLWELRDGDRVVADGFTTAEECCRMAPFSFRVEAPPGEYTLVVQDSDPSGGEGFAPWVDTKTVRVVP